MDCALNVLIFLQAVVLMSTDADPSACLEWGGAPTLGKQGHCLLGKDADIIPVLPGSSSLPHPQLSRDLMTVTSPKPVSGILSTLSCLGAVPAMLTCVPRAPWAWGLMANCRETVHSDPCPGEG